MNRRPLPLLLATVGALLISAACAPQDSPPAASTSPSADACGKDQLQTLKPGTFTVGTDDPAYAPWFVDNKPANGQGFESAVAYAVAGELGYDQAAVTWVTVPFTSAYAPGTKTFDVDVNQVSITDARRKAVDFSAPYYTVSQTVVTTKGSPSPAPPRSPPCRAPNWARRWARPRTPRSPTRSNPARRRRSTTPTTSPCRPCRTGRSTASWSICRPRSTWSEPSWTTGRSSVSSRPVPARPTSSAWCSP